MLALMTLLAQPGCSDADSATHPPEREPYEFEMAEFEGRLRALEELEPRENQAEEIAALRRRVERLESGVAVSCDYYAEREAAAAPGPVPSDMPPVPTWFDGLVTEAVVRQAARTALSWGANFHDANYSARAVAFESLAERQGGSPFEGLYDAHYDHWRRAVMDVARGHLADPGRLWSAWQRYKPIIVEEIEASEYRELAEGLLEERVLPAFEQPIAPEVEAANRALSALWSVLGGMPYDHVCRAPLQERYQREWGEFVGMIEHPDIAQWRLRREAEGGPALSATWRRVFQDLHDTL